MGVRWETVSHSFWEVEFLLNPQTTLGTLGAPSQTTDLFEALYLSSLTVECQFTFPYFLVVSSLRQATWIIQQKIINLGIYLISKGSLGNPWGKKKTKKNMASKTSTDQQTYCFLLPSHFSGPHILHIMASAACRPQTSSLPKPRAFDCNLCSSPLCLPSLLLQSTQREINLHL